MFHYKGRKMHVASSNTDLHGYGEEIRRELGRRISREKRLKVLDVGTGFGINVAFLARWLAKGSEVWSIDPSKDVLEEGGKTLPEEGRVKVRFAQGFAHELDFEDGSFDVVVSVMVLHHIERLRPALREMVRVLRPGGLLILVDYKPEASRELEFISLHVEKDFFSPAAVGAEIRRLGMKPRPADFGLWFLSATRKPRSSVRAGEARAGRAR